jgi:GNAT superfamily N-acetyltransferase
MNARTWTVIELTAEQTHPLRRTVLRNDTPSAVVSFPEDAWPGARHLGVLDDGVLVGVSTWVPRPLATEPEVAAVQLRGMATAQSYQGHGVGSELVAAGCDSASAAGVDLVWANARDTALAFYRRHGFVVAGEGFVDRTTGLAHHVIIRRLT